LSKLKKFEEDGSSAHEEAKENEKILKMLRLVDKDNFK
jgi:hypothetical protein